MMEIRNLFHKERSLADLQYKEKERKSRSWEIAEETTRGEYTLDWSQSEVFLVPVIRPKVRVCVPPYSPLVTRLTPMTALNTHTATSTESLSQLFCRLSRDKQLAEMNSRPTETNRSFSLRIWSMKRRLWSHVSHGLGLGVQARRSIQ